MSFLGNQMSTVMGSAVNVIGSVTSGIVNWWSASPCYLPSGAEGNFLAQQGRIWIFYSLVPEKAMMIIPDSAVDQQHLLHFISGQCLKPGILAACSPTISDFFRMPYIPLVKVIIAVTASSWWWARS